MSPRKKTPRARSPRPAAHQTGSDDLKIAHIHADATIRSAEIEAAAQESGQRAHATALWRTAAITAVGGVLVACLTNFAEVSDGFVSATSGITRLIGGNESSGTPETTPGTVETTSGYVDYEAEARQARMRANAELLAAYAMATNCDERPDPMARANCEGWKAAQLAEAAKLRRSLNMVRVQAKIAVKMNG